jgi:type III pantothenate kinase
MQSGIIYGTACMTDGMTARFREALGDKAVTLATGGLSKAIIPHCRENIIQDDNLILDGLYVLYRKNMQLTGEGGMAGFNN